MHAIFRAPRNPQICMHRENQQHRRVVLQPAYAIIAIHTQARCEVLFLGSIFIFYGSWSQFFSVLGQT